MLMQHPGPKPKRQKHRSQVISKSVYARVHAQSPQGKPHRTLSRLACTSNLRDAQTDIDPCLHELHQQTSPGPMPNDTKRRPRIPSILIYYVKQHAAGPKLVPGNTRNMVDTALGRTIGSRAAAISEYSVSTFEWQWVEALELRIFLPSIAQFLSNSGLIFNRCGAPRRKTTPQSSPSSRNSAIIASGMSASTDPTGRSGGASLGSR